METKELLFANRCKSIPVFNSTCFMLNEYYNRVKEINMLTKYTMQIAETTIKTSICIANPFVEKFKDQVQALDSIACQQLDKLEAAFPILLEDTTKVVNEGKIFITKTVQPAVSKINTIEDKYLAIKKYGLSKVNTNHQTNKLIKRFLDSSERFIETYFLDADHRLIRSVYEQSTANPTLVTTIESVDLANRARMLTCALYLAVQRKCLRQIDFLMHSLNTYLDRLNRLVDLLDRQKIYIKTQFQAKMNYTKQRMTFYREYLELLCKQMMVQDGRSLDHVHSVEERGKILIRRSLGNFLTALFLVYKKLNSLSIDNHLREKFFKVMDRLINSYKFLQQANFGLNEKVIYDCRVILYNIQVSIECFLTALSKTTFATWLVPNFDVFGVICSDNDLASDEQDVQERVLRNNLRSVIEYENVSFNETNCTETSTPKIEILNKSFTTSASACNLIINTPIVSSKQQEEVVEEENKDSSTSASNECQLNATTSTFEEEEEEEEEKEENVNNINNKSSSSTSTLDTSSQKNNTTTTTTTSEDGEGK